MSDGTPLSDLLQCLASPSCPLIEHDRAAPSLTYEDMDREDELLAVLDDVLLLEKNHGLVNRFNIFQAIGMARQEIRHSRFLSFLLDPSQNHGLGDKFLKSVLLSAIAAHRSSPVSRLTAAITDCANSLVYCERDHFDISVEIPELKLLLVIENKVGATERHEQLAGYRGLARSRYHGYAFLGIFLTPEGYRGDDEEWVCLSYYEVVEKLRLMVAETNLAPEVSLAITNYIDLIEKEVIVSEELISACKKIYAQHRQALELIMEHGRVPVLAEAFAAFSTLNTGLKAYRSLSTDLYFVASSWLSLPGFQVADQPRWRVECPVHCWFSLKDSKLYLRIEVGPVQDSSRFDRSRFVEGLSKRFKVAGGKKPKDVFTRIKTVQKAIADDLDVDETCNAMLALWDSIGGRSAIDMIEDEAKQCLIN